jgi:hypothetical protein
MEETPPDRLYKYRKVNEHTKRIVTHSEIYFQSPLKFNDLFDCRCRIVFEGTTQQRLAFCWWMVRSRANRYPRGVAEKIVERMMLGFKGPQKDRHEWLDPDKLIRTVLETAGVMSLAEKNNDTLMWSHYADSHKGVCLEFSGLANQSLGVLRKVQYQDAVPVVEAMRLIQGKYRGEIGKDVIKAKAKCWRYEEEWRSILPMEGRSRMQKFSPACLTGIVLGANISKDDERQVRSWAKGRTTPLTIYRAEPKDKKFGFVVVPAR